MGDDIVIISSFTNYTERRMFLWGIICILYAGWMLILLNGFAWKGKKNIQQNNCIKISFKTFYDYWFFCASYNFHTLHLNGLNLNNWMEFGIGDLQQPFYKIKVFCFTYWVKVSTEYSILTPTWAVSTATSITHTTGWKTSFMYRSSGIFIYSWFKKFGKVTIKLRCNGRLKLIWYIININLTA